MSLGCQLHFLRKDFDTWLTNWRRIVQRKSTDKKHDGRCRFTLWDYDDDAEIMPMPSSGLSIIFNDLFSLEEKLLPAPPKPASGAKRMGKC